MSDSAASLLPAMPDPAAAAASASAAATTTSTTDGLDPAAATAAATTTTIDGILIRGIAWVVLDTIAEIGRCNNETTAGTNTSAHRPIEVSFKVVDPPRLSRCVVHCPDLIGDLKIPPLVTGTDAAFLLIRVTFPERDGERMFTDVFVYRADPREPSLRLLPPPYPVDLHFNHVGMLASGEHCFVVIPERRFEANGRMSYDLQIFSTKSMLWSTKVASVASDLQSYYGGLARHEPTKVFSIRGGLLAWVDLRYGILLCNVLGDEPEMRLIQLPPLMPSNKIDFAVGLDGTTPPLDSIRDVSFTDGFRFIEMEFPYVLDDDSSNVQFNFQWRATMFKRTISSGQWDSCHTVNSADLSPSDPCFLDCFPEIWDCEEKKMSLSKKVISQAPMLDMYHDGLVYMTSKLDAHKPNGWVFAVDIKSVKLVKVLPFSAKRVYLDRTWLPCAFSKYLRGEPTFSVSLSEQPLSFVTSVMLARNQFKLFEKYLTHENWLQIKTFDPYQHIKQLTRYGTRIGQPKASSDADLIRTRNRETFDLLLGDSLNDLTIFMRTSKEIELLLGDSSNDLSTCDEAVRHKIGIAIGALNDLLQRVPSKELELARGYIEKRVMSGAVDPDTETPLARDNTPTGVDRRRRLLRHPKNFELFGLGFAKHVSNLELGKTLAGQVSAQGQTSNKVRDQCNNLLDVNSKQRA